jgi:dinuclear metal center YbgI/SA1388 family protein
MAAPRVSELLARVAARAPFDKAASGDPVGLMLGDPDAPVRRAALCHEVTDRVVDAVERERVDLLVTYHPLLFRPTRRLIAGSSPEGRALRLARAGAALAVVHTNFDVATGGAADALAEALALEDVEGFGPLEGVAARKLVTFVPAEAADALLDALAAAGAARIGNYSHCSFRAEGTGTFLPGPGAEPAVGRRGSLAREPELRLECLVPPAAEAEVIRALRRAHPYEEPAFDLIDRRGELGLVGRVGRLDEPEALAELARRAAEALCGPPVRIAGDPGRPIARLAVVPGSGGSFLAAARAAEADAFLSGDLGHHDVRGALDSGLSVLDVGHAASERPGLERLLSFLATLGVELHALTDLDADPWLADGADSHPNERESSRSRR